MIITSTTFEFNLEPLLNPIETEHPAGEFLRYEGTYDRINEARRRDDPNLERGVWTRELKQPDWDGAAVVCLDALTHRTKDLQIAAWLMEAWLHQHGFAGAGEGLRVLNGICRAFWDCLYPSNEDPEFRLLIFHWINEKLSTELKFIPITHPSDDTSSAYCWADWEMSCYMERIAKQHAGLRNADRGVTSAMFDRSALLTPLSFYLSLSEDLISVLEACMDLENFLDAKYGKDGPSLRSLRNIVESVRNKIAQTVAQLNPGTPSTALEKAPPHQIDAAVSDNNLLLPAVRAPVRSRTEAYEMLAEAADFLERTEPHSPTPYLVRRAISWGNMTLEELLPEMVRNNDTLNEVYRLLSMTAQTTNKPRKE